MLRSLSADAPVAANRSARRPAPSKSALAASQRQPQILVDQMARGVLERPAHARCRGPRLARSARKAAWPPGGIRGTGEFRPGRAASHPAPCGRRGASGRVAGAGDARDGRVAGAFLDVGDGRPGAVFGLLQASATPMRSRSAPESGRSSAAVNSWRRRKTIRRSVIGRASTSARGAPRRQVAQALLQARLAGVTRRPRRRRPGPRAPRGSGRKRADLGPGSARASGQSASAVAAVRTPPPGPSASMLGRYRAMMAECGHCRKADAPERGRGEGWQLQPRGVGHASSRCDDARSRAAKAGGSAGGADAANMARRRGRW